MKPPPFDYSAPDSLEEALSLLRDLGDEARPLAGGQSLIPLLSLRLARPSHLIDLARVADSDLSTIRKTDGHITIGAMVREGQAEADESVRRDAPLLAEALPLIGHPAIRSRGTIGGSLSHADPSAELPAVAVAIGAELVAQSSARGRRSIKAEDFFTGFLSTAMEADEILVQVRFPEASPGTGTAIAEVARRHGDFAMVGAATAVRMESGRIAGARVVLTGVSDTPLALTDAEKLLSGAEPTDDVIREVAAELTKPLSPPADVHGSSAYRRHVATVLISRTLQTAVHRAGEAA